MRLHILSDLHLEFGDFAPTLPKEDFDVLILAGDIGSGKQAKVWAEAHYSSKPHVIIPGNHEAYGKDLKHSSDVLPDRAYHVIDDVHFVCATLWTDFKFGSATEQTNLFSFNRGMADPRYITYDGFPLSAQVTQRLNEEHRRFIVEHLKVCDPARTVVVTHHAPHANSITQYWRNNGGALNASFTSNFLGQIPPKIRPKLWVHGHTHSSLWYHVGKTTVVCNPRGYTPRGLNPNFNPNLIVEI